MAENEPNGKAAETFISPTASVGQSMTLASAPQFEETNLWNAPGTLKDKTLPAVSPTYEAPQEITDIPHERPETTEGPSEINGVCRSAPIQVSKSPDFREKIDEKAAIPHRSFADEKVRTERQAEGSVASQQSHEVSIIANDRIISEEAHITTKTMDSTTPESATDVSSLQAPNNASRLKIAPGLSENPICLDDDLEDDGDVEVVDPPLFSREGPSRAVPNSSNGMTPPSVFLHGNGTRTAAIKDIATVRVNDLKSDASVPVPMDSASREPNKVEAQPTSAPVNISHVYPACSPRGTTSSLTQRLQLPDASKEAYQHGRRAEEEASIPQKSEQDKEPSEDGKHASFLEIQRAQVEANKSAAAKLNRQEEAIKRYHYQQQQEHLQRQKDILRKKQELLQQQKHIRHQLQQGQLLQQQRQQAFVTSPLYQQQAQVPADEHHRRQQLELIRQHDRKLQKMLKPLQMQMRPYQHQQMQQPYQHQQIQQSYQHQQMHQPFQLKQTFQPHQVQQPYQPHQQLQPQLPTQQIQGKQPHQQLQAEPPPQHLQPQFSQQHLQPQLPQQRLQPQFSQQHLQPQLPQQHSQPQLSQQQLQPQHQQQYDQKATQKALLLMQQYQHRYQSAASAQQNSNLQVGPNLFECCSGPIFREMLDQVSKEKSLSRHVYFVQVIDSPILSSRISPSISASMSSPDFYFLSFLEIFSFGRRPRTNSVVPHLTPTARAFCSVYTSKKREKLPAVIGMCCLACKRRSMERRQHWCDASAVHFPSSVLSFHDSLIQLRLHISGCAYASQRDKDFISGAVKLPSKVATPFSLYEFSLWYCSTFQLFVTSSQPAPPVDAYTQSLDERKRVRIREEEEEKNQIYQDLQDAVAGGFEKGVRRKLGKILTPSLMDIPCSTDYPDTTLGLLLLDSLELVTTHVASLNETSDHKRSALFQCKYCHGQNGDDSRDSNAFSCAPRAADGSINEGQVTKELVGLFYRHTPVCRRLPKDVARKISALRLELRTERFNHFVRSIHQRCVDASAMLRNDYSSRSEPEKDRELWVSPTLHELGKIWRKRDRELFEKITEAVVEERGCKIRDIIEFPRMGILHGGFDSSASTKNDLSKQKRTFWSDRRSRVVDEEHLEVNGISSPRGTTYKKKARITSTGEQMIVSRMADLCPKVKVEGEETL